MTTIVGHTTRASGTVLTAAIYNADHNVHVVNAQALNAAKLEGATPPVVDGHAVVWNGTSGAALRSAGAVPVTGGRIVTAGSGLTGGGSLAADITLAADFATQAEAEAGSTTVDVMSPLRTKQQVDFRLINQATAEARTDNAKLMTALRTDQLITSRLATLGEAQAGTEATHLMTPALVAAVGGITLGSAVTVVTSASPWASGINATPGAIFWLQFASVGNISVSTNGGTNFTATGLTAGSGGMGILVVSGTSVYGCVMAGSSINSKITTTGNTTINISVASLTLNIIRIV